MQQSVDVLKAIIAAIPIIAIFIFMLALKLASYKAGGIALLIACILAALIWKLDMIHICEAIGEGVLSALLPIALVIFTAMLLYNLSVFCGATKTIQETLTRYAPDEPSLVLLIAFGFGSFLESVSGFGTPVVVPAAILILFGFSPLRAAVICLVANTMAVALGVVGIPAITLSNITSLPVYELSVNIALQLFLFCILLPCLLVQITVRSIKVLKKYLLLCLVSGFTFAAAQLLTVWLVGPELPAVVASLCTMLVIILWQKRKLKNRPKISKTSFVSQVKPWSAYIIILLIVIATRLIPALGFLSKAPFVLVLPIYEGKPPFTTALLTNPGMIILISAILFSVIYKINIKQFFKVSWQTLKQVKNAILTIILIVTLAKILSHSGMIDEIALGIAALSGSLYPLLSPVIGCLGTFVTGSDTSSNILFGLLQKQTAIFIGANPLWLAASNASGATIGKMISPLSIALATASTGQNGGENNILKITVKYALVSIVAMAIFIYITSLFIT